MYLVRCLHNERHTATSKALKLERWPHSPEGLTITMVHADTQHLSSTTQWPPVQHTMEEAAKCIITPKDPCTWGDPRISGSMASREDTSHCCSGPQNNIYIYNSQIIRMSMKRTKRRLRRHKATQRHEVTDVMPMQAGGGTR